MCAVAATVETTVVGTVCAVAARIAASMGSAVAAGVGRLVAEDDEVTLSAFVAG